MSVSWCQVGEAAGSTGRGLDTEIRVAGCPGDRRSRRRGVGEVLGPRGTGLTKAKQAAQLWEGCRSWCAGHAGLLEKPLSAWQTLMANTGLPVAESNLSQPRLGYSGGRGKRRLLYAGFASHESFKEPTRSSK